MQVLHHQKKSAQLNTVERNYIHAEFTANKHLNDNQNTFPNPIFDAILNTHQQYPRLPPSTLTLHSVKHLYTPNPNTTSTQVHNTCYRRVDMITAQRRYIYKLTKCYAATYVIHSVAKVCKQSTTRQDQLK